MSSAAAPPRRRLTRAEAKARTRERLLEAAARVFSQKGFAGASVEEIAEAAGYTIGALYANFEGKEQLFLELLSSRVAARMDAVAESLRTPVDDDRTPLETLSKLLVQIADREREFAPLLAEFWLYAVRNPEARGAMASRFRQQLDAIGGFVAQALERVGAASEVSSREVATVVLSLANGLVRQRRIVSANVPDELFGKALRWMFAGLHQQVDPAPRPRTQKRSRPKQSQ